LDAGDGKGLGAPLERCLGALIAVVLHVGRKCDLREARHRIPVELRENVRALGETVRPVRSGLLQAKIVPEHRIHLLET